MASVLEILRRPDCYIADHTGAVLRVEFATVFHFIDFQKAVDSVDRNTQWKLLRQYGKPKQLYKVCTKDLQTFYMAGDAQRHLDRVV